MTEPQFSPVPSCKGWREVSIFLSLAGMQGARVRPPACASLPFLPDMSLTWGWRNRSGDSDGQTPKCPLCIYLTVTQGL